MQYCGTFFKNIINNYIPVETKASKNGHYQLRVFILINFAKFQRKLFP